MRDLRASVLAAAALLALPAGAAAQEAADYYRQNCFSCHTIGGGKLVGPDLKDVAQRRDRAWLVRFIADPKAMIDGGDATATQLLQEYRGVVMPTTAGMNPARAEALVRLIEEESKLAKSHFLAAAGKIPERPFTAAEIETGRRLFLGLQPLSGGGPSCVSCHAVAGSHALGGGRLGPDLTNAYSRLQARNGLAGWLSAPPSPTMAPVYKKHPLSTGEGEALGETAYLVAFLEEANRRPAASGLTDRLVFLLLGLAGAAGCIVLFDFLWRGRFRSVRGPLVGGSE